MSSGIRDGEPAAATVAKDMHNMPHPNAYPPAAGPFPINAHPAGTPGGAYAPAPPVAAPPNAYAVQEQVWSTGLCDCMNDIGNCCITCWCPCITFGRIAEIVDRGSTSCGVSGAVYAAIMYFTCCQWIYSFAYRTKLRAQYNLPESPCCDCCVHYCCQHCALCQEYRELKNRGFDMNIGWQLNVQRASGGMQPPMMPPGMMR